MVHKLQGADTVGDAFEIIAQAMRVVVERIDAPLVASVVMRDVADSIKQWIAQPHVGRSHINLAAQRARPVGKFAGLHPLEEIKIFRHTPMAEGAFFAGLIRRPAIFSVSSAVKSQT